MAEGRRYECGACGRAIEAWDEGRPYYRDHAGQKRHAYHPDPARDRCTGVDSPMLCTACGHTCESDSAAPRTACPRCQAAALVDTWHLEGCGCPFCGVGTFAADPAGGRIS